ncbi:MAG: c-type cytochrome [Anaerolineales bacterium]|nr:c-type cytochrome [Anaerolineales bacterium]
MKNRMAFAIVVGLLLTLVSACGSKAALPIEPARPSNPGDAGEALKLTGAPASGKEIFAANCVICHGEEGEGGVENPGTADGTVPSLNPAVEDLWNDDFKTFAYNADLFIEHGSTPAMAEGVTTNPLKVMPNWGDLGALTPQQIADVISYLYSLNKE